MLDGVYATCEQTKHGQHPERTKHRKVSRVSAQVHACRLFSRQSSLSPSELNAAIMFLSLK